MLHSRSMSLVTSIYEKAIPCGEERTAGVGKGWAQFDKLRELAHKHDYKIVVYEKDDSLPKSTAIDSNIKFRLMNPDDKVISIDNATQASCDYPFIYHIYENYDNLSDVNVFTKVNIVGPAGVESYSKYEQFLQYAKEFDFCDTGSVPLRGIWNLNLQYESSPGSQLEQQYYQDRRSSFWFDQIFRKYPPMQEPVNNWGHGPFFAVSKSLIRRHPREVYKFLLDDFQGSHNQRMYGQSWCAEGWIASHDMYTRFYRVLFTHGADVDENFIIQQNLHLPQNCEGIL
jgi:hypothetical protein